jgi:hypothetical protein
MHEENASAWAESLDLGAAVAPPVVSFGVFDEPHAASATLTVAAMAATEGVDGRRGALDVCDG